MRELINEFGALPRVRWWIVSLPPDQMLHNLLGAQALNALVNYGSWLMATSTHVAARPYPLSASNFKDLPGLSHQRVAILKLWALGWGS